MRYHEAVEYLFDLRRFRLRPGTAATRELLDHLGRPEDDYNVVQIAGSNGKGSTARMLASILEAHGLRVGLYTSPHIDHVHERVRIDNRPITEAAVVEYVETVADHLDDRAASGEPCTFFETLTAMAFWAFAREGVDVAVVEVGIGGRHDATSAVEPVASAVTNVTLEHTDVLGGTVEEIARDKAAVAVPERPLVTGSEGEALAAIRDVVGSVTTVGEDDQDVTVEYGGVIADVEARVDIQGAGLSVSTRIPLPGRHQARNAGIAAALARQLGPAIGLDITFETIASGLRSSYWPGRFDVRSTEPLVVLDGAHNPAACVAVAETLEEYDYEELTIVFGAMHEKDHAGMADALPPAARVLVTEPATDRAESRGVLERAMRSGGTHEVVERVGAVETAVDRAVGAAEMGDCVLVTGSLYTVAEASQWWDRRMVPKRVPDLEASRAVLEGAHVGDPGIRRMRAKGVHRVIRTRLRPRQAQYLKEELLSRGGECAIGAAGDGPQESIDVVCSGTLAQFRRVIRALRGQPYGLDVVAEQLRHALGIQIDDDARSYPWTDGTAVMGILNVTPDSFHDGGEYTSVDEAVERARSMAEAGAHIIDIGGESTNPNADPTPADVERERVLPVLEALAATDLDAMISIDTRKATVADAALAAGADLINDVSGLEDPGMRFVAADHGVPLVLMHSIDTPVDPDHHTEYDDVVRSVIDDLGDQLRRAVAAGVDRRDLVVDPGLGFGKTAAESWELVDRLDELRALGCPILLGHSHKSMLGAIDRYPDTDGTATVATTALGVARGADIVRVHDVAENVSAVRAAGRFSR